MAKSGGKRQVAKDGEPPLFLPLVFSCRSFISSLARLPGRRSLTTNRTRPPMTTKPPNPPAPLLTIKQAAAALNSCTKTVHRLIAKHELAVVKLGRFIRVREDDLERFIARHRLG